jgi:hypothetical protein
MNVRNLLTIAAVIALIILALFWHGQRETLQGQERQIKDLSAQLKSNAETADLDLQDRCALQAGEEFKLEGLEKQPSATFSNHFNKHMAKCFVVTQNNSVTKGSVLNSKMLVDAYEGRVIAEFLWINSDGRKYWEVSPTECDVLMPSGEKETCHSSEEFDELIKVYMEDSTL